MPRETFLPNWPHLLGRDIIEYYPTGSGAGGGGAGICLLSSHYNYNNLMDFRLQSCPPHWALAYRVLAQNSRKKWILKQFWQKLVEIIPLKEIKSFSNWIKLHSAQIEELFSLFIYKKFLHYLYNITCLTIIKGRGAMKKVTITKRRQGSFKGMAKTFSEHLFC